MIKSESYINIQGWMVTELNLKGNDLLVYAIIYGFSQNGTSKFTGSLQYIADWCNSTKQGIQKNLKNLLEAGLIEKSESETNGVKYCSYSCTVCNSVAQDSMQLSCIPCNSVVQGGMQLSCINKLANSKTSNLKESNSKELLQNSETKTDSSFLGSISKTNKDASKISKEKPKKKNLYEKCLDSIFTFTEDKSLRDELINFLQLRLEIARDEGKQFYYGMWTHLLSELKQLTYKDGMLDTKLAVEIVNTSCSRCWKHFYPLTSNDYVRNRKFTSDSLHNKINESGAVNVPHITKEEEEELERAVERGELREY